MSPVSEAVAVWRRKGEKRLGFGEGFKDALTRRIVTRTGKFGDQRWHG